MRKPIRYPKNFKLAVMAAFRHRDGEYDEDIRLLLKRGSPHIRDLLVSRFNRGHLPFSARQVDQAFNHMGSTSLRRAIKRDTATIARFGRLLDQYSDIVQRHMMEGAMETGEA